MAPALRLFWPTPGPRHLGEGGAHEPGLLVGWWRESERAGGSVDAVVAGVIHRPEDLDPLVVGAGRWENARRYEGLGPPTLIGAVSDDGGERVDVPKGGSKSRLWIEASRDDDGLPMIDSAMHGRVEVARGGGDPNVLVVLHDPPSPPLRRVSVRSVAGGADRSAPSDDETGLEWATRAMELGGRLHRLAATGQLRRPNGALARLLGHAADGVARVLDARVIPGVLDPAHAHSWRVFKGKGVRWRDSCEVFAAARVVRSRARCLARHRCLKVKLGSMGGDEAAVRGTYAAMCGSIVLVAVDVALGCVGASFLLSNVDAVTRVAMGGSWNEHGANTSIAPLYGHVVSANAEWLMHGSPLGVKLHVPLATFLAELATTMVDSLSVAMRYPGCAEVMRGGVVLVAWSGVVGGMSLQAALAADVTTFLTTHLAALHVYSSLIVTAQIAAARRLYTLISPPQKSLPEEDPPTHEEELDEDDMSRVMEGRVFGTLALAPVALLLPTTAAFYLSYLALHALTVFVRAAMVLVSATLQHPRFDLLALRLCHPGAFPGGVTVRSVGERGQSSKGGSKGEHGSGRVVRLSSVPAPWHAPLGPFVGAALGWTGSLVGSVARACGSFGRLPVAVVPFEPAAVAYFDS